MTAMKKSTSILITIFVITLLFCFFVPIIFYKPVSPIERSSKELTLIVTKVGEQTDTTLKSFNIIRIDLNEAERYYDPYINITDGDGAEIKPILAIQETEGISAPRMVFNRGWRKVVKFNELDSVLSIGIDTEGIMPRTAEEMEADVYESRTLNIVIPSGSEEIGTLQVPPGMLESISGKGGNIVLKDFKNAELNVGISNINVEAENCSFKSYMVSPSELTVDY